LNFFFLFFIPFCELSCATFWRSVWFNDRLSFICSLELGMNSLERVSIKRYSTKCGRKMGEIGTFHSHALRNLSQTLAAEVGVTAQARIIKKPLFLFRRLSTRRLNTRKESEKERGAGTSTGLRSTFGPKLDRSEANNSITPKSLSITE